MKMTYLGDLVGQAEPMDPASMQYKAAAATVEGTKANPERACCGCIFKGQKAKVCVQAGQLARLANMPDCEDRSYPSGRTFIYVERETDQRQIDLTKETIK